VVREKGMEHKGDQDSSTGAAAVGGKSLFGMN